MSGLRIGDEWARPVNSECWALGTTTKTGHFHVRRIVWGRALAREEKRAGEEIRKCIIFARRPK